MYVQEQSLPFSCLYLALTSLPHDSSCHCKPLCTCIKGSKLETGQNKGKSILGHSLGMRQTAVYMHCQLEM